VTGALTLATCGLDPLMVACPRCGRAGRYRRDTLIARFGADAALPDVLTALAACDRAQNFSDPCQARYPQLSPRPG